MWRDDVIPQHAGRWRAVDVLLGGSISRVVRLRSAKIFAGSDSDPSMVVRSNGALTS